MTNKPFPLRWIPLVVLSLFSFGINLLATETHRHYLSGHGPADAVDWDFKVSKGRLSGEWRTIPVPSHWEQHGFGNYNYGHDLPKHDEVGFYRRSFYAPDSWEGKTVYLVFEGVMTDTHVRVNGDSAGPVHQGGFYRFRFDITRILNLGESNLLEVEVHKVSANASLEVAERKADFWVFGGIYRPVYLEVVPGDHIDRVAIDARADGTLRADVVFGPGARFSAVRAIVETLEGQPLGEPLMATATGEEGISLAGAFANPRLWSAETPNLYRLRVQGMQGEKVVHERLERFGFRTIEFREGKGFFVNGKKILFKGVNRHSFHPDKGRALDPHDCLEDALAIKAMNANAVRCAHYPPRKEFLEYCDEIGLYVMNELCTWQKPPIETELAAKLVKELVTRDVNHPSIFAWANGNEGGWNPEVDHLYAKYDPQERHLVHPWADFRGLNTDHYEPFNNHLEYLKGPSVFLPTEFLHGLYDGGHGAGLEDYWRAIEESPFGIGGFLWVWRDEALVRTDRNGALDTDGNHAPDGIVGPYGEKEGSYATIQALWAPVKIEMSRLALESRFQISNQHHFLDLKGFNLNWSLHEFPEPEDFAGTEQVLAAGRVKLPEIAPGARGNMDLRLPEVLNEADALLIQIVDAEGREVLAKTWNVRENGVQGTESDNGTGPVVWMDDGQDLRFKAGEVEIWISGQNGRLLRVERRGKRYGFDGGPRLVLPGLESQSAPAADVRVTRQGDLYRVRAIAGQDEWTWTLHPDGGLELEYHFQIPKGTYAFSAIGFDLDEKRVAGKRWVGDGPYRVWNNRKIGPRFGYWEQVMNHGVPGYRWDLPAFKGIFQNIQWLNLQLRQGLTLTVEPASQARHVGVLRPENGPDPRKAIFAYPETGGLFFFHHLPAHGTKFHLPEKLGPMSEPFDLEGSISGKHRFNFH